MIPVGEQDKSICVQLYMYIYIYRLTNSGGVVSKF